MKPISLVRKVAMAPAISYLAGEGVPVDRYLHRAKLSAPSPETLEALMPLHQLCAFLSSVARAEGIHDLGFRIAGHLGIESLGSFGRLIKQAFTLHESIQISRELSSAYNSGLRVWIERHGEQVKYCQKHVGALPPGGTTEIDHLGLANALATAGIARGSDWRPTRIELTSDPINLGVYFPDLDELPVSFNQPQTSIWLAEAWLSKPLPAFESSPCYLANDNDRASLVATGPSEEPIGQFEQVIESTLGQPEMNLEFTAAIAGTSARTLQRHLAKQDTSFSRLLQAVRFRSAQRLLRDPRMPVTEIGKRLGYTDLANFMRAFNRWAGVGPTKFRRLHYADGHG